MKRLIIVGSPRANGRSAHLAEMLFEACIDECPEDELYLAPVSELEIGGCIACDACKKAGQAAAQAKLAEAGITDAPLQVGADGGEDEEDLLPIAYCPRFDDDMLELYDVLSDADELSIVSPVFFSGAPAGLTALLDRLQPYFWEWLALRSGGDAGVALAARKRPATLHVIGEGLDKNGYIALVSKVRSALAPAGFRLERVLDWVGKIDADGTIQGEADEYALPPLGTPLVAPEAYLLSEKKPALEPEPEPEPVAASEPDRASRGAGSRPSKGNGAARPKLDLSGQKHNGPKSGNAKSGGKRQGSAKGNGRGKGSGGSQRNGKRRG